LDGSGGGDGVGESGTVANVAVQMARLLPGALGTLKARIHILWNLQIAGVVIG